MEHVIHGTGDRMRDNDYHTPTWWTDGTPSDDVSADVLHARATLAIAAELAGADNVPPEAQRLAIAELAKLPEWMAHLGLKNVPLPSSRREWDILLGRLGADVNTLLAFKRGEIEPWEVIRLAAGSNGTDGQPAASTAAIPDSAVPAARAKSTPEEVEALLKGWNVDDKTTPRQSLRRLAKRVSGINGKTCSEHTVAKAFVLLDWPSNSRSTATITRRRTVGGNALNGIAARSTIEPADSVTEQQAINKINGTKSTAA